MKKSMKINFFLTLITLIIFNCCSSNIRNNLIINSLQKDILLIEKRIITIKDDLKLKNKINYAVFCVADEKMLMASDDFEFIVNMIDSFSNKRKLSKNDISAITILINKIKYENSWTSNFTLSSDILDYLDIDEIGSLLRLSGQNLNIALLQIKRRLLNFEEVIISELSSQPESNYYKFNLLKAIVIDNPIRIDKDQYLKEVTLCAYDTTMIPLILICQYDSLVKNSEGVYTLNGQIDTLPMYEGKGIVSKQIIEKNKKGFSGIIQIEQSNGTITKVPFRYKYN